MTGFKGLLKLLTEEEKINYIEEVCKSPIRYNLWS